MLGPSLGRYTTNAIPRLANAMHQVVIAAAQESDAEELRRFARASFIATYEAYNTPADLDQYVKANFSIERIRTYLSDRRKQVVIAKHGDRCAGYAQLSADRTTPAVASAAPIELERLYVDATLHGQGVAQRLLQAAKKTALEMGGHHLWLGVWENNPRAIKFYKKSGFQQVGEIEFWFGSAQQNDFVLVLDLAELLPAAS